MNLSGLSAVYPGYSAQENSTAETAKNQAAATEAQQNLAMAPLLGRAFQHLMTGQVPTQGQGPQPPAAGQPSMPAPQPPGQVPNPMVQGGPPAAPQPPPPPQAPYQPPIQKNPETGQPEVSLESVTKSLLAANPGLQNHPELLMRALSSPVVTKVLDRKGVEDVAELRKEYQTRSLEQRGQIAASQLEAAKAQHATINAQRDAALELQKSKESRLQGSTAVRQDQGYQRLQLQSEALAQRAQQSGDRNDLAQWRAAVDALHKRATEIIQSNSKITDMSTEDKKALLDEQRTAYEGALNGMRQRVGATTPTGGTVAPGAPAAPKIQGQVAPGQPGPTGAPPAATLPPDVAQQVQDALSKKIPREAIIKRLQEQGYPTDGL